MESSPIFPKDVWGLIASFLITKRGTVWTVPIHKVQQGVFSLTPFRLASKSLAAAEIPAHLPYLCIAQIGTSFDRYMELLEEQVTPGRLRAVRVIIHENEEWVKGKLNAQSLVRLFEFLSRFKDTLRSLKLTFCAHVAADDNEIAEISSAFERAINSDLVEKLMVESAPEYFQSILQRLLQSRSFPKLTKLTIPADLAPVVALCKTPRLSTLVLKDRCPVDSSELLCQVSRNQALMRPSSRIIFFDTDSIFSSIGELDNAEPIELASVIANGDLPVTALLFQCHGQRPKCPIVSMLIENWVETEPGQTAMDAVAILLRGRDPLPFMSYVVNTIHGGGSGEHEPPEPVSSKILQWMFAFFEHAPAKYAREFASLYVIATIRLDAHKGDKTAKKIQEKAYNCLRAALDENPALFLAVLGNWTPRAVARILQDDPEWVVSIVNPDARSLSGWSFMQEVVRSGECIEAYAKSPLFRLFVQTGNEHVRNTIIWRLLGNELDLSACRQGMPAIIEACRKSPEIMSLRQKGGLWDPLLRNLNELVEDSPGEESLTVSDAHWVVELVHFLLPPGDKQKRQIDETYQEVFWAIHIRHKATPKNSEILRRVFEDYPVPASVIHWIHTKRLPPIVEELGTSFLFTEADAEHARKQVKAFLSRHNLLK